MTFAGQAPGIPRRRRSAHPGICLASARIYMRPDIEDVPVARLVANLETDLAADPKNPDIHLRLARLYAVVYFGEHDGVARHGRSPAQTRKPRTRKSGSATSRICSLARLRREPAGPRRRRPFLAEVCRPLSQGGRTRTRLASSAGSDMGGRWNRAATHPTPLPNTVGSSSRPGRRKQNAKFAAAGQRFDHRGSCPPSRSAPRSEARRGRDHQAPRPGRASRTRPARDHANRDPSHRHRDREVHRRFRRQGAIRCRRQGRRQAWTWISPDAAWLVYDPQVRRPDHVRACSSLATSTFWNVWQNGYEPMRRAR